MKQIDKDKLCNTCLGCNRLLLEEFNGTYKCNSYIKADLKENKKYLTRGCNCGSIY